MRLNKLFILYSLFGILMASCIKDEAPNAEADITGISFEEDVLANSYIDLNPSYDESQNAYPIRISVKEGTDMTSLAPIFELTPGATISPASGCILSWLGRRFCRSVLSVLAPVDGKECSTAT